MKKNTNCLEGWRCPVCGSTDSFEVLISAMATLLDDGTDEFHSVSWEPDNRVVCPDCMHAGTVSIFTQGLVPGLMYVRLFHGRKDPSEQMDDWGEDGEILGPFAYVHQTYNTSLVCGWLNTPSHHHLRNRELPPLELCWESSGLIEFNGMYYGDISIFTHKREAEEA